MSEDGVVCSYWSEKSAQGADVPEQGALDDRGRVGEERIDVLLHLDLELLQAGIEVFLRRERGFSWRSSEGPSELETHIVRRPGELVHVGQLERAFRLHRLGNLEKSFRLLSERSNALCIGRSWKDLWVGGEGSSVGQDVLGEDGGVGGCDGRHEEEL